MNFDIKERKNQLIILGGVVVLLIGLFVFMRSPEEDLGTPTEFLGDNPLFFESNIDPVSQILGRDILNLVAKMKQVNLDTSFFSDPAFQSLQDFTVEIKTQPIGRRDPFAPLE